MSLTRKHSRMHYSTNECREMMKKEFRQFVDEHIINQYQQELIQNYSLALEKDRNRQENIKYKLNNSFFNKHKQRRDSKQEFISQFALYQNQNQQIKLKLTKQLKKSLTFAKSNRKTLVRTPSPSKNRYIQLQQLDQTIKRPKTNRSSYPQNAQDSLTLSKCNFPNYSLQLQNIIEQSDRIKSRPKYKRRNIMTASEKKNRIIQQDKSQKDSIITKIIEHDVEQYLKSFIFQKHINGINPYTERKIYEEKRRKELRNFDKYNMSFTSYMKQKTQRNIQNTIYNDKIRQKDSYVQKFQTYILQEFKFSEQAKRRLEKVFKSIELEFKRPVKNREISQRLTPR